ncbi:MAG: M23 family metallopeptidase [Gilvibacter sp.]
MHTIYIGLMLFLLACGGSDDNYYGASAQENPDQTNLEAIPCAQADYPNWEDSDYVLPYPVGSAYQVNLNHCGGSYHSEGQPDQYAIDFAMPIGELITAARGGTVIYVEQSGADGGFPNNLVVVKHNDNTFAQYMHLTQNGALVSVGQNVAQGTQLGYSGATGLAGYPHLHFVVTQEAWEYPYVSIPYNFKNTAENPRSLLQGESYPALPY